MENWFIQTDYGELIHQSSNLGLRIYLYCRLFGILHSDRHSMPGGMIHIHLARRTKNAKKDQINAHRNCHSQLYLMFSMHANYLFVFLFHERQQLEPNLKSLQRWPKKEYTIKEHNISAYLTNQVSLNWENLLTTQKFRVRCHVAMMRQ
jgi:hypothetical protein